MNHRHVLPVCFRMRRPLPIGRHISPVGVRHGQQHVSITDARATVPVDIGFGFSEIRIGAVAAVEKFVERQQPRPWENIFHEQRFTPSGMSTDHIRIKPLPFQGEAEFGHRLSVQELIFHTVKIRMRRLLGFPVQFILNLAHARHVRPARLCHKHNLVPVSGQSGRQMLELTWHILMHKENFH